MDIFQEAKSKINILQVCNLLNIKLNKNHMCLCMFHHEKTPSFSVSPSKNIFCCFSCGKKGDSITLVSELLNIKPFEALVFLNNNLGLGLNISNNRYNFNHVNIYEQKKKAKENWEKWKKQTFGELCDYIHELKRSYEKANNELNSIENVDKYFENEDVIKYYNNIDKLGYYADFFIYGTEEDIMWLKKTKGKVVK